MATCKDCISFSRCIDMYEAFGMCVALDISATCKHFKNKSDYTEVKHGKWIDNINKMTTVAGVTKEFAIGYKCSLCGRTELMKEPYCNCGAKMRCGEELTEGRRNEMLINLWVKDKRDGHIHQVGTDVHDSIVFLGGEPRYYNMQNGDGTGEGDEYGYEWVEPPDIDDYVSVTPEELRINRELIHKDVIKMIKERQNEKSHN